METLTVCINTYEYSDLLRLGMSLVSFFYRYSRRAMKGFEDLRREYYKYIRNSPNVDKALQVAEEFFIENVDFIQDEIQYDFLNKHIKFLLVVDGGSGKTHSAGDIFQIDCVKLFIQFCKRFGITNYFIILAKKNYRIQVMRTVAFRNCTTDYMMFADDDDMQGMSVRDKFSLIREKTMKVDPRKTSVRISFLNVILFPRQDKIVEFEHEISGSWSKVYSNRLCQFVYHIPSVSGGEDWITNRRIIGMVIKPYEEKRNNFVELILNVKPRCSYLWFPSLRNVNIGALQNKMSNLHAARNGFDFGISKNSTRFDNPDPPEVIQNNVRSRMEKGSSESQKDIIYHEDEVVEVFFYDNAKGTVGGQNLFICPRLPISGIPPRNVRLEGGNVVEIDSTKRMPPWVRPTMSIDYWNSHLKKTPYNIMI